MRIFCCSDDNSDKSSCIIRCIKQQSSTLSVKSAFVCGMLSSINPDASFRLSYLKYECPVNGNISIHQIVNSSFLKTDQETHICRTAVACSKLFLQFVLAVPVWVIFECSVHRIAEFLKEVHIPVTGINHHNTSAIFLRFLPDIREETGTCALIAVWLIHPQDVRIRHPPAVNKKIAPSNNVSIAPILLQASETFYRSSAHS